MSYILEALKRNEQDREIGHVPTVESLQHEPLLREERKPYVIWFIATLLLVNAGLLSGYFFSQDRNIAAAPESKPILARAAEPEVSPLIDEEVAAESEEPIELATAAAIKPDSAAPPRPAAPPVVTPAQRTQATASPPLIDELPMAERQGLPPLSLDVHVFAEQPERRFVLLNLHKLHEGERLKNTTVEAITPEGVVLSWQGVRFRLQRQ